jgi:hypothetical protein
LPREVAAKIRTTTTRRLAAVVVAFCQGVRDEKMLEMLATQDN